MEVFKFGGGSVRDAEGVKQLTHILTLYPGEKKVVVVSAIGKTTNLLEAILDAFMKGDEMETWKLFTQLEENHYHIASVLLLQTTKFLASIEYFFHKLKVILEERPSIDYDYEYDRIVSFGELLSTTLISAYLTKEGVSNQWIDARQVIRTDSTSREGKVNWDISTLTIRQKVKKAFAMEGRDVVITQGFIGGTALQRTTTLGREGSDYSAAIFGYALDVDNVTIWKDVPGFFTADPRIFPDAVKLDRIPYEEAIELSYYGASIIHPKTLKPLQNKNIPLHVKSFFTPELSGTTISAEGREELIPCYIFKKNQILISIFPRDFSFIAVDNLSEIFHILSAHRIKINLMQNSALSFSICVDNIPLRVEKVLEKLEEKYKVKYNDKVELATIRHYSEDSIRLAMQNKIALVEQKNRTTIQLVLQKIEE